MSVSNLFHFNRPVMGWLQPIIDALAALPLWPHQPQFNVASTMPAVDRSYRPESGVMRWAPPRTKARYVGQCEREMRQSAFPGSQVVPLTAGKRRRIARIQAYMASAGV